MRRLVLLWILLLALPLAHCHPESLTVMSFNLWNGGDAGGQPDEVAKPVWTWTPLTRADDPSDRHNRIDFVFVRSQDITVTACQRVGEPGNSEIPVQPWPSDHRAIIATIVITES
ncbi:hypothetical protein SH528x_004245 [Novipirellula sp. SH528]|uniref:hypothetical protein n=1 Tax=Novipirellula sp. SH528 TaxID=3454466 RepID=UPI003FA0336E